jgi:wyosine [tRNA(Phe)-imidazoG37] synthetase (radical SAM superfamily)
MDIAIEAIMMTPPALFQNIRNGTARFGQTMMSVWADVKTDTHSHPSLKEHLIFGPVPSRRLGHSLGINNIVPKTCSYDCVYCQVGRTSCRSICRQTHVDPYELFRQAKDQIALLIAQGICIDYISFVANGEPTLDLNLSKEIRMLREFGYKIAVFTNSSLLWNDSVKEDLLFADYVSVKVDTVTEATSQRINRPHSRLRFQMILDGVAEFSRSFCGVLTTETMLVKNMNDSLAEAASIGEYLATLKRSKSYFAIPIRPPAERYAIAPESHVLTALSRFVGDNIPDSEMLCLPEGTDFEGPGSIEEELLGILSVHPMNEGAIESFIQRKGGGPDTLQHMVGKNLVRAVIFEGTRFYINAKTTTPPME